MVGIPVQVLKALNSLVLETPTANQKVVDNRLLAALETFVVQIVNKVVNLQKFMSRLSNAVIDIPGLVTPVAALVKSEL